MEYPNVVKGLAYRISSGSYFITVSFVLERNLRYPELGFNFNSTAGQGVTHSSQLTFLTKADAQNFIDKYIRGTFYHPYITQISDIKYIRIDQGGDIPCYVSDACCDYYSHENRLPKVVSDRMNDTPVSNPFIKDDPELQAKEERAAKRQELKDFATNLLEQILVKLDAEETSEGPYGYKNWKLPLDVDSDDWSSVKRSSEPHLIVSIDASKPLLYIGSWYNELAYRPLSALWSEYQEELGKNNWKPVPGSTYESLFSNLRKILETSISTDAVEVSPTYSEWFGIRPESKNWTVSLKTDPDKLFKKILSYKEAVEEAMKTFADVCEKSFEEEIIE